MALTFKKPHPVVAVAVAAAFIALCLLGSWQLRRLVWKTNLIQEITENLAGPPVALPPGTAPEFLHVTLPGHYVGKELFVGARYYNQELGYHVLMPFQLEDGRVVLVNRGWIGEKEKDDAAATQARVETNAVTLEGIVRHPVTRRLFFMPDNMAAKNLWFWFDLPAMKEVAAAPIDTTYYVEVIGGAFAARARPIALTGEVEIPNDHLQYAVTWFLLAAVLITMFLGSHVKRVARP